MSTYLVAFAVGEFDYVEDTARPAVGDPIAVRVYTNPGESAQGEFALGVACRVLEYLSSYFGVAYPLSKLDMLAVPDFSAGS